MDLKSWPRHAALPLPAVAAALVAGCYYGAAWSVRVVQRLPLDEPRQRIYVIVHEGDAPARYATQLVQAMSATLGRHLVCRGAVVTGVEFDRRRLDVDVAAFRPDAVLEIKPIGARVPTHHGINAIYGFTLIDRPSNRTVWTAKAEPILFPALAEDVAKDIATSLVASRTIPARQPEHGYGSENERRNVE